MKTNKLFLLPLLLAILGVVSCGQSGGGGDSSSANEPSFSSSSSTFSSDSLSSSSDEDSDEITAIKKAPFYMPAADQTTGVYYAEKSAEFSYATTKTYGDCEAFADVDSLLDLFANTGGYFQKDDFSKTVSGQVITYDIKSSMPADVTITVDASKNTVSFSDFDVYVSLGGHFINDACVTPTHSKGMVLTDNGYTSGGEFTFNLGDYGLDILFKEGKAYIPAAAYCYLFLNSNQVMTAWNGEGFYYYYDYSQMFDYAAYFETGVLGYSPFGKQYYAGPYADKEPSESVATLHGNESMFYLDHFYGFLDDERFPNGKFSEYLKENHREHYDLFFSAGKEDSQKAWDYLTKTVIGDGHTITIDALGSFYASGAFTSESKITRRTSEQLVSYNEFLALRQEALNLPSAALTKEKMFEIYEDMAVIRFDSFNLMPSKDIEGDEDYLYANMASDLYCQMAYSFAQIKKNGGIKKVVIDLSCNTGGTSTACIEALCFLKDSLSYNIYNPLTGSNTDASFTGKFAGREKSYEGEYDFYVLTSYVSFSCGNLFPTVVKRNGSAKVIGQRSGGGACMVQYGRTPDGQYFQISGLKRLSLTTGKESNDAGIEPDISIYDTSYYYDMAKLRSKLV